MAQSFIGLANDIVRAFSSKIILRLLGLDSGTGFNIGGSSSGNLFQKLLGGLTGGSGNYTTPPFVGSFTQSGNFANQIPALGGGNGSAASGGLGSILALINGRTPNSVSYSGGITTTAIGRDSSVLGGSSGGIGLAGGLTLGGAAGIIGSLIGGRAGGFISSIGSGVATGAAIGSIIPGIGTTIGAVIGGGVGFLASLFGGDPKRKADKKQLPALNQGFTDAFTQFSQRIKDVKTLRLDGESALSKGAELRSQVASGFCLTFQSKKYKKESDKLIQAKLAEIDKVPGGLFNQLRKAVDSSNAANERQRRLLPEFAVGNFFGRDDQLFDMRRGLIIGNQPGKDRHLGLFADGEAILNRRHQENVKRLAGYDILAHAGIPNYPRPQMPKIQMPNVKRYAEGNFFGPTASVSQPRDQQVVIENLNVYANHEISVGSQLATEIVSKGVATDAGHRALVKRVNNMDEKKDVNFQKRVY